MKLDLVAKLRFRDQHLVTLLSGLVRTRLHSKLVGKQNILTTLVTALKGSDASYRLT
jgi:hypothetical protein